MDKAAIFRAAGLFFRAYTGCITALLPEIDQDSAIQCLCLETINESLDAIRSSLIALATTMGLDLSQLDVTREEVNSLMTRVGVPDELVEIAIRQLGLGEK